MICFKAKAYVKRGCLVLKLLSQAITDLGGVEKFTKETGREGYYGWFGYGGSVFQWNPELRVGFAFVPTSLHWYDMTNTRGKMLQQEVVKCVKNRQL